jgi:hypothetical protein
MKINITNIG